MKLSRPGALLLAALSSPLAAAQAEIDALPMPGPPRNAGTFHVASGTWTRGVAARAALGPDTIYSNVFDTGLFAGPVTTDQEVTDHGRLPSTTSPPPSRGQVDVYRVNGFEIAYCTRQTAARLDLTVSYWEHYAQCDHPTTSLSGVTRSFQMANGVLPASSASGVLSCWTVTMDLENTTGEFCLNAEANGRYDAGGAEDTFGWVFRFGNVSGGASGPVIAGSCVPASPSPGMGTYYNAPSVTQTTGLGTNDFFWIQDTIDAGCFFFGGCNGNDLNPYASFWQVLMADTADNSCIDGPCGSGGVGVCYCPAPLNSTGANGVLSAAGSNRASPLDLTFTASPIPDTAGLLFFGPQQIASTPDFGEGVRCAGGSTSRVFPVGFASGNTRSVTLDENASYASAILSGRQLNFQYWFRETMDAGDLDGDGAVEPFSTTSSVSIAFQ